MTYFQHRLKNLDNIVMQSDYVVSNNRLRLLFELLVK